VKKTAAVIGATVVVAALLLGTGAGYGSLPGGGPVYFLGYTEQQEIEANYMAVRYLAAINIAPDTLFDALTKLTPSACMSSEPVDSFAYLADWGVNHHPGRSGEDLGKMLDAGVIVLPQAHAR
jgi:predicted Zn-dependent protease